MPSLPKTIFKFESFTEQSLINLKSQCIYFGSPRNFNDPYDCAITASIADPTCEEVQRVRAYYLNDPDIPAESKASTANLPESEFKSQIVRGATNALAELRERFLDTRGVTCFSERHDDLLMWAHYGGRYKGFCLEFCTEFEPFNKIRPVHYIERMPTLRVDSMLVDKDHEKILELFHMKSSAWAYEKEWRCLHQEAGTIFTYATEALKAVYFGPDMEPQAMEISCLILAGQNPNVEFWESSRNESEFKVDFDPFEYVSYIDAKRCGLR